MIAVIGAHSCLQVLACREEVQGALLLLRAHKQEVQRLRACMEENDV